jgi:hypothetical protein
MEILKLDPELLDRKEWGSGRRYEEINKLSHLRLKKNGTVIACYKDQSSLDVTDLFPINIIESYRAHNILVRCYP